MDPRQKDRHSRPLASVQRVGSDGGGAVSDPLSLSSAELRELTGYRRASAQQRFLAEMGVPSKPRPDGSLLVLRRDLEREGVPRERPRPNLATVRAPR